MLQARTKLRKSRNWALKKALELVKASGASEEEVVLKWESREVTVGDAVAFKQEPGEPKGSFRNNYAHLTLP